MARAKGRRVVRITGYLPREAAKQFTALCRRFKVRQAAGARAALLAWLDQHNTEVTK